MRRRVALLLVLGLLFALVLPILGAPPGGGRLVGLAAAGYFPEQFPWWSRTVDSSAAVGEYSSLALDQEGRPHISYYDATNNALKHAYLSGTVWLSQTVDGAGSVGRYTSLAVDALGQLHLSYEYATAGDLRYAYLEQGVWVTETVDSAGAVGLWTSLDLELGWLPHIAYYDDDNNCLKHAWYDGSNWSNEVVDASADVGRYASLAVAEDGTPHISYYNATEHDLKYAYLAGSVWLSQTVDSGGWSGAWTSLALDGAGQPQIAYYDPANQWLKYAYLQGSLWISETVDSALGVVGGHCSLVLDGAGRPHIAYYDAVNDDLKYAYVSGALWLNEVVDSAGLVGIHPSLALDGYGRPSVSYFDDSNDDLKYAQVCIPLEGVEIAGPLTLPSGIEGEYNAEPWPLSVTLPLTITWDNGTVGAQAVYSWTVPGSYALAVTAANGCGQAGDRVTVTVICEPLVGIEVSGPAQLLAGEVGTYAARPQPPTASLPISYTWDNGTLGPSAEYAWSVPGSYGISVAAQNGCSAVEGAYTVQVSLCDPLRNADFDWQPLTPTAGQVISFSGRAEGTAPIDFSWDFGDGNVAGGPEVTHSYALAGDYVVRMPTSNPCGSQTPAHLLTVQEPCRPVEAADFNWSPLTATLGEWITFNGSASGTAPLSFQWDFGDGAAGSGEQVTHAYAALGDYAVTMTGTNDCGQDAALYVVTVAEGCNPVYGSDFSWQPLWPVVDLPVTFSGLAWGTPPFTFSWDFGDGAVGAGSPVAHAYALAGDYVVTMTVGNGCGMEESAHALPVGRAFETHLPLIYRNFAFCYLGPWEQEDNDSAASANGPLCPGRDYYGYPDDADDYFSIEAGTGPLNVGMWDYAGEGGQLILYDEALTPIVWDNDPANGWYIETDVEAGLYFLRLYTAGGYDDQRAYRLQANFSWR